jgi:hypothetical protein
VARACTSTAPGDRYRDHALFDSLKNTAQHEVKLPSVAWSPSAEDRLSKSLRFAECDVIIFVVRASGVHEVGYGHKWDWEA